MKTSSLVSLGVAVPEFVASTAHAAEAGGDNILVVVELSGGNDGLNTVIPYGDDLYHKARPTLRFKKGSLLIVDEHIGLHSQLRALDELRKNGSLAIVQGVGYPNPNRSHFESKDTWHTADPKRKLKNGWLGRRGARRTLRELCNNRQDWVAWRRPRRHVECDSHAHEDEGMPPKLPVWLPRLQKSQTVSCARVAA